MTLVNKREFWIYFFLLALISLVSTRYFISPDPIIFWDYNGIGKNPSLELVQFLQTWHANYLGYATPQLTSFVFLYFIAGFTGPILANNFLLVLLAPLALYCMYFLCLRITSEPLPSFLAALVYSFNPYFLDRFLQAHIGVLICYALVPLVILLFSKISDTAILRYKTGYICIAGVILGFIGGFNTSYLYIIFLLLLIYLIVFHLFPIPPLKKVIETVIVFIAVFGIAALFLFSYIAYIFLFNQFQGSPTVVDIDFLKILSGNNPLFNIARLVEHPGPGFYELLGYYKIQVWTLLGLVVPCFALAGIVLHKKEHGRWIVFSFILLVIGLVLATGTTYFSTLYTFLYTQIPFFYAFRESTKFLVFVSFSYSLLAGMTAAYILSPENNLLKILKKRSFLSTRHLATLLIFLIIFLHLGSSLPLLTGDFSLSKVHPKYELSESYRDLGSWLDNQEGDFRVIVLPYDNYIYHTWGWVSERPQVAIDYISLGSMPFNSYQYSVYTMNQVISGTTDPVELAGILNRGDVKYIIVKDAIFDEPYPESYTNKAYKVNPSRLKDRLNTIFPVAKKFDGYTVYENPFYSPDYGGGALPVLGNRELLKIPAMNTSYIFIAQQSDPDQALAMSDTLLINTEPRELPLILLNKSYKINAYDLVKPARDIPTIRNEMQNGWVRSDTFEFENPFLFRNGSITYGPGYAITEGKADITTPVKISKAGKYDVWIRGYGLSPLTCSIDDQVVGTTGFSSQDFTYQKIGSPNLSQGDHAFRISAVGLNAVDQVAIVPSDIMDDLNKQSATILAGKKIIDVRESNISLPVENNVAINLSKITPTHYSVKINQNPDRVISLKTSYNSLWIATIDGREIKPIMADSYSTGFFIENGTTGQIEFLPQKTMDSLPTVQTVLLILSRVSGN